MKRLVQLTISATVCSLAVGCGESAEQPEGTEKQPRQAAETVENATEPVSGKSWSASEKIQRTVEAGCAKCMFQMKGIDTHELAVKIDGKPYLVTGEYIEPTETGLCEDVKNAQVIGQIIKYGEGLAVNDQTGEFIAESIQLQD